MSIKNNIEGILAGLKGYHAKLIAVSKTQPVEKIREAYDAGQRLFGENKAQEMMAKQAQLPADIQWHMIGHLQTNKVKYIAPFVAMIHSVDSLKLLEEINKQAKKNNRTIACLLQIHIAKEETKFGFTFEEVTNLLQKPELDQLENIRIEGLMGMATLTDNEDIIRTEFRSLKEFFDFLKTLKLPARVGMNELSMGMTSDYKIALQEGSTLVRIGTAVFGERNYTN
jgi:pyridoxal phosphate enzyme (YggS family)